MPIDAILYASLIKAILFQIVSVCVSLGEYPTIRYYRPRAAAHEASVLCSHLARFIQEEIDMYATYHKHFPPPSNRPRGVLYVLDRSMDLVAPVIHEFTYQAMCHDLLPIRENEKVTYRMKSSSDQEERDVEISEKDKIWTSNRHRHMKDTIERLMGEFQRFMDDNPHFTNQNPDDTTTSISAIKDMMAGLPEFQEMKEAYSLHLTMAQESMNQFQARRLPDLASIEQILGTGLDEDHKKPKGVADQVVRSLDEEGVGKPDRLRLIMLYLLYREGILPADLQRLIAHAELPSSDAQPLNNLGLLGARISRPLKDKAQMQPLFPRKPPTSDPQEEYSLSRFEPAVKLLLEEHCKNSLDLNCFPYTKPQLEPTDQADAAPSASLRSAKPTWAKGRSNANEPRQRVIVFMAGGATYSESRSCYEIANNTNKDVYLITSHMLTPSLFVRQLGDLSVDKRQLRIPMEQPKPKAPAHLFEPDPPPPAPKPTPSPQPASQMKPPTAQMGNMSLNAPDGPPRAQNGAPPQNHALAAANAATGPKPTGAREEKEKKKKKGLFHMHRK